MIKQSTDETSSGERMGTEHLLEERSSSWKTLPVVLCIVIIDLFYRNLAQFRLIGVRQNFTIRIINIIAKGILQVPDRRCGSVHGTQLTSFPWFRRSEYPSP